ncbi:MAG: hypothetical protein A2W00_02295 [Candidatus Eisenbacteria bacterium RBG_16_71_46]|nr:MAG: hypothetical protein A2W00_02295 [Candidatus Eisenbacteria bacterium RBG_16_71_46]OGF23015.1 MAG: hypothetical protein A2V63_02655 [Candidatus Eisenbacteria bacterium RBG_19FT_COMBO_70_11]
MESNAVRRQASREPPTGFTTVGIDRRRFLIVLGGTAAYMALRPRLAAARKPPRARPPLQPWTLPDRAPESALETARALIGAAILAPSHWNSQPWRFEVEDTSIRLLADTRRALPVTDPDGRWMMASLGAALENLLVAARAYGLRPTVDYFPFEGAGDVVAQVSWTGGDAPRDRSLFGALPRRRTNRRGYDGRTLFPQNRAQISAQVPESVRLHWIDDRDALRPLADLAYEATKSQVLDARAEAERYGWMRFGDSALERGDGVMVDALEMGGFAHWFAGRYFDPNSWFLRFGAESAAHQARDAIRSGGSLVLLTTPVAGNPQWVVGGQAYERLALKATQLGIAQQPLIVPLEVPRIRDELVRRFDAQGEEPLLLVRLGHAKAPPPSVRRAVALVTSYRTS